MAGFALVELAGQGTKLVPQCLQCALSWTVSRPGLPPTPLDRLEARRPATERPKETGSSPAANARAAPSSVALACAVPSAANCVPRFLFVFDGALLSVSDTCFSAAHHVGARCVCVRGSMSGRRFTVWTFCFRQVMYQVPARSPGGVRAAETATRNGHWLPAQLMSPESCGTLPVTHGFARSTAPIRLFCRWLAYAGGVPALRL